MYKVAPFERQIEPPSMLAFNNDNLAVGPKRQSPCHRLEPSAGRSQTGLVPTDPKYSCAFVPKNRLMGKEEGCPAQDYINWSGNVYNTVFSYYCEVAVYRILHFI